MSVSSLEGSPVPLDLPAKYQKLAAEYAKIRAQLGVLKKAVVDEQNQTAELKEILKIKDQNLRKAEQELDSLNFRNQQLTKRVAILQDELDSFQNSSKSSKSKTSNREIKTAVIVEELQKKIAENASLISTLQEQTEKYENEKFKLNQKIEIHEHKIKEYQTNLSLIEETKLAKYENENKLLLSKLNTKEDEIKKLNNEIKKLKCDIGWRNAALNNSFKENFSKLMQNLMLHDFFTSLSQFFQQLEFRYNKHMEKKHFQKFLETNQKNRLLLQDFADKYLLYCSVDVEQDFLLRLENFCDNIQNYTLVLQDLSECLEFSKDEEVILIIKEIIFNFKKHWTEFYMALMKFQNPDLSPIQCEDVIGKLIEVFRSFRGTCDYFLSAFNVKFKSSSINEESEKEILALLAKMSLQSSTVYKKLTDNSAMLMQALEYRLIKLKQKTAFSQADQCCEHCKQEFELLKATHIKKIRDLEEQISCLSEATTPHSINSGIAVQSPFEEKKETEDKFKDCETGDNPNDIPVIGEEAEIIKFFNTRANKLVADRQYAESRVTVLKDECENLKRRLEHSLESRLILEDLVKQAQNNASRLQEELQTTTINYEIQLQSMSEHMANMNEKFASQEEEIEILKHQLIGKFQETRKGKSN